MKSPYHNYHFMNHLPGYMNSIYAYSLCEFGVPWHLSRSGGWILKRQIPGFSYWDAMGPYPLFFCQNWAKLQMDLEELGEELVSISLVTDPFGQYDPMDLRRCFKDVVIPFKNHLIADLCHPLNEIVSKGNRKKARKALKELQVDICEEPIKFIEEWNELYRVLIQRHDISGIRAFSKAAFAKQFTIPGTVVFRASYHEETVGATIYFVQENVAYCHLGAVNQVGYDLGAFYALDLFSIEFLSGKVRYLDLGGGAGIDINGADGLSQYKRGWANDTRTTYFCGRIFDLERYRKIIDSKGIPVTNFFPAYRNGEFV